MTSLTTGTTPAVTTAGIPPVRRLGRALAAVSAVAGLTVLAACGSDDPSGNASPSSSASASAAPTAGGSGSPSPSGSPEPSVKPSKNLNAITVKGGGYGDKPKVQLKTPWAIDKTQSEVLESGDGNEVQETDTVKVDYQGVNGRTGKVFDSSFQKGRDPIAFPLDQVIPGFKKGLVGKHVGDRVLIAMTGKDGYDSMGGNSQAGIKVGDSLIFVADITAATLEQAEGEKVQPEDGLPTVDVSGDTPQLTVPDGDPPKKITVQPLIKGEGEKVGKNHTVTTKSMTWVWKDGSVADESWKEPWAPDAQSGQTRLTAMQQAMVGQPVGSRLLVVFPPGTAYKHGDRAQGIGKDDTVIMVIDILFTQPSQ